jgi:hypothetical protein
MLDESGVADRKFRLHLDTTAMPGGVMKFAMEDFTRRALQAADEGYREVQLTTENAEAWGWRESMAPVDVDYASSERLDSEEGSQRPRQPRTPRGRRTTEPS